MPVGFVGLGAMGYHMAGHMAKSHAQCLVWNRTGAKAGKKQVENSMCFYLKSFESNLKLT